MVEWDTDTTCTLFDSTSEMWHACNPTWASVHVHTQLGGCARLLPGGPKRGGRVQRAVAWQFELSSSGEPRPTAYMMTNHLHGAASSVFYSRNPTIDSTLLVASKSSSEQHAVFPKSKFPSTKNGCHCPWLSAKTSTGVCGGVLPKERGGLLDPKQLCIGNSPKKIVFQRTPSPSVNCGVGGRGQLV